jgi:DnaJ-class molecular chaperone
MISVIASGPGFSAQFFSRAYRREYGLGSWLRVRNGRREIIMANEKGPNIKKKQKCKNCEGKGLLKKGDKVVKCQRCGGTGVR